MPPERAKLDGGVVVGGAGHWEHERVSTKNAILDDQYQQEWEDRAKVKENRMVEVRSVEGSYALSFIYLLLSYISTIMIIIHLLLFSSLSLGAGGGGIDLVFL